MADKGQGAGKPAVSKINAQQVEQDASWLGQRMKEPSTYAGLGVLLTLVFHISNAGLAMNIQTIGIALGTIILAVLAIIKPGGGGKITAAGGAPIDKAVASLALLIAAGALLMLASPTAAMAQTSKPVACALDILQPRPRLQTKRRERSFRRYRLEKHPGGGDGRSYLICQGARRRG